MSAPPESTDDKILAVLGRYMSPILAKSVLSRAVSKAGLHGRRLTDGDLPRLTTLMDDGARLFVEGSRYANFKRDLLKLQGIEAQSVAAVEAQSHRVRAEADISIARTAAREMAERLGARRFVSQRIATAVSELARNIVNYTPGGEVQLIPMTGSRRAILVRATDTGRGIKNLEQILSGRYISQTGLGAGIAGTRKLADRFDLQTGDGGTTIEAEFDL